MTSSNIQLRVDLKMKCFIQLARKCIVDNIEEEIEKTDNDEIREALIEKLTMILEGDIIFTKPSYNNRNTSRVNTSSSQRIPSEPVNVRGTPLKLKNMSNNIIYHKFCSNIAKLSGYAPDFSDSPFNNLVKNTRVYEAIKRLYASGLIDQNDLDQLVNDAELENNTPEKN